jgi:hypothetical protein
VAFGDHLGADEDVDLAVAKPGQQSRARPLRRIASRSRRATARRDTPFYFRFHAFGAEAGLLEIWACAERTRVRHARAV